MPHRSYRTLDDLDVEDLGVFEYLDDKDDEAAHFVPAPPPRRPRLSPEEVEFLQYRLRVELPMVWLWVTFSVLFMAGWAWLLCAGAMIAVNIWLRPAYQMRGMIWLFYVYIAAAAGQVLVALSQWVDLGPIRDLLGPYGLAVVMVWIVLEMRYQIHLPFTTPPPTEDDQVYYYYG